MRKRFAAIFVALLALASLFFSTGAALATNAPPVTPVLTEISTSHAASARVDLVAFRFEGAAPTCTATYVPRSGLIADPSGKRLLVAGRSFVKVTCHPATAHDEQGRTTVAGNLFSARTTNVIQIKLGGDFEAVLTYFVGLRQGQPAPPVQPSVSTSGNTVVVGIPTN